MNKNLYIKPEIEVIEMELQGSVMLAGSVEETLDPSDTTGGSFDGNERSFWGN